MGNRPVTIDSTVFSFHQGFSFNRGNNNRHVQPTARHVKGPISGERVPFRLVLSIPGQHILEGMWVMTPVTLFTKCRPVLVGVCRGTGYGLPFEQFQYDSDILNTPSRPAQDIPYECRRRAVLL